MRTYLERLIEHSGQSESINYDSLTANVNEIFCIAHTYYVNVVKKFCVDYNLYKRLILSSIKHKLRKWLELKDINWQFAFNIFEHVLLEKKNLLIDFFETQPIGDYCGLIRSTLGEKDLHVGHSSKAKSPTIFNADGLLFRPMPKEILIRLTDFVNEINLFNRSLTEYELLDFFECKEGAQLMANNNNQVALFLLKLSQRSFLKKTWASITVRNRMLISSSGIAISDSHNLTAPANKIANKTKEARNCEENLIIDFVESL